MRATDDDADVLLPIAPFTETSGTFVNAEGRVQSFHGVVKPLGEARPAWKVLRVLGNLLGLGGFRFETSERSARRSARRRAAIAGRRGWPSRPMPHGCLRRRPQRPRAHRRRADLRHRPDRAPRAGAADDRGCAAAGGRHAERAAAERGIVSRRPGARAQGGAVVLPRAIDPSLASNVVRVAAGIRSPRRSARCSAPRASLRARRPTRCSRSVD